MKHFPPMRIPENNYFVAGEKLQESKSDELTNLKVKGHLAFFATFFRDFYL